MAITKWNYDALVEDIRSIIVERITNALTEKMQGYHEIGERILEDKNFDNTDKSMEQLARDTKIGVRNLYRAVQFARSYPNFESFIKSQPKHLSWSKVANQLLPDGKLTKCAGNDWVQVCRSCRVSKESHI